MANDFSVKAPSSVENFTLDFVNDLDPGETIVSATASIALKSGVTDPDIGTMVVGFASVTGTKVTQLVQGGLAGNVYKLILTATTNTSEQVPLEGDIPVNNL